MQHFSVNNPYLLKFDSPLTGDAGVLSHKKVAVKDLFHIAGMPTSAGNPDWLASHTIPTETSPVLISLLKNGASLVGKTITDELAYSLNGQNIHYGTPVNTRHPDQLPGGSSSGSAIAVADGSADIGLGTDTGGSIRIPASYNGLFGLRPSHGLVSTEQMVGLAPDFDTVGWLTRDLCTLSDVAQVLLPQGVEFAPPPCPRLGVSKALNAPCEHHKQLDLIINRLAQSAACELVDTSDKLNCALLEHAAEAFRILQGAQIWATHGAWITRQQPKFAPEIAARFNWCQTINASQVAQAQVIQKDFCILLDRIFNQVDFMLLPTTPGCAPLLTADEQQLAKYRNSLLSLTCIAGLGGLPQLHIPLQQANQLPVGLSVIGPRHSDRQVIQFAKNLLEIIK